MYDKYACRMDINVIMKAVPAGEDPDSAPDGTDPTAHAAHLERGVKSQTS